MGLEHSPKKSKQTLQTSNDVMASVNKLAPLIFNSSLNTAVFGERSLVGNAVTNKVGGTYDLRKRKKKNRGQENVFFSNVENVEDVESALTRLTESVEVLSRQMKTNEFGISKLSQTLDSLVNENRFIRGEISSIKELQNQLLGSMEQLKVSGMSNNTNVEILPSSSNVNENRPKLFVESTETFPALPSKNNVISYADIAKKSNHVVIIKPKNQSQDNKTTMATIRQKISSSNRNICNVKNTSNGGIVVECSSKNAIEDLKNDAEVKLGDQYSVNIPSKILPKVRVFGLSALYTAEQIKEYLMVQNKDVFDENCKLNILNTFRGKLSETYGFKFETDPSTFFKVLEKKFLTVDWDLRCLATEAVDVLRCYNCSRYHHTAKNCKSKKTCPKCSGEHEMGDCTSEILKCVNCMSANESLHKNLDVNHCAWDPSCAVLVRLTHQKRQKIDYITAAD